MELSAHFYQKIISALLPSTTFNLISRWRKIKQNWNRILATIKTNVVWMLKIADFELENAYYARHEPNSIKTVDVENPLILWIDFDDNQWFTNIKWNWFIYNRNWEASQVLNGTVTTKMKFKANSTRMNFIADCLYSRWFYKWILLTQLFHAHYLLLWFHKSGSFRSCSAWLCNTTIKTSAPM